MSRRCTGTYGKGDFPEDIEQLRARLVTEFDQRFGVSIEAISIELEAGSIITVRDSRSNAAAMEASPDSKLLLDANR